MGARGHSDGTGATKRCRLVPESVAGDGKAIRIPYRVGQDWKSMQPDFIFVTRNSDGALAASIVDPRGHHLADALAKLRGLAAFAEKHADRYQQMTHSVGTALIRR